MASKICKKCGWEVDRKSPLSTCPVCHTVYKEGYCRLCGCYCTDKDYLHGKYCRECFNEQFGLPKDLKSKAKRRDAALVAYNDWADKIKQVPTTYPTLTEEQWLEVCQHFNGCAVCDSEDISARGYFIPFKYGGKYCDWNIIPLCEHCATYVQSQLTQAGLLSPFSLYLRRDNGREVLQRITKYLEVKLNNAISRKA